MRLGTLIILIVYGCGLGYAEMAQDLEIGGNVTEQKAHALDFFRFDLHHTGTPLAVVLTILGIALVKPLILKIKKVPPSIILLFLGYGISWILWLLPEKPSPFVFKPDQFFVFYLPFIVADAGWFLPTKDFFHNFGQISIYAVIGTVLNAFLTLMLLLLCKSLFINQAMSILSLMVFSTIISAVDPVAVISVFEETHVNSRLNILVFGESLLNDGVVIVLYNSLQNMLIYGEEGLNWGAYISVLISFCVVVGFGFFFGMIFGLLGVILQRVYVVHQALMPTISIGVPYVSYLMADTFGFSGLVALITCCIIMKNFVNGNVCLEMQYTTEFIFKNMGSYSESFIFILLGFSTGSLWDGGTDVWFVTLTIVGTFFIRFIVIFTLTGITNGLTHFKEDKIAYRDQFIMAYGGLRGAVCYGLIASIDDHILPEKQLYVSAIMCTVLFTTCVQGISISYLVNVFNVKKKETKEKKEGSLAQAMLMSTKHLTHFLEDLTQSHEENIMFRWVRSVNDKLKAKLCHYQKPKNVALLEDQVEEETFYRKGTSFAGLPTDHSLASMHLPASKSELFAMGYNEGALMPPSRPKPSVPRPALPPASSPIPRNESISEILPTLNQFLEREQSRAKRKSVYSRHVLGYTAPMDPTAQTDRPPEEEDDESACQMTFPYAKNMNQKILAQQARSISKSVKDKGHVRFHSPHRALTAKDAHYKTYHASTGRGNKSFAPPRFTITDEESPSPPNSNKPGRARTERKITSGTKTFVVGGEDIDLLPINEDDDKS